MSLEGSVTDKLDREKEKLDVFTDVLTPNAAAAIENLCKFIKSDPVLIHVDFSNTGLSEKQLWYFGRAMRRSKSLRALHLCGNPGITDRLKTFLKERARCLHDYQINHIDSSILPSERDANLTHKYLATHHLAERDKETVVLKHVMQHKRIETRSKTVIENMR
jgi:hypothetical protein